MSLSKSKFWHSNNCLHFSKRAVPLTWISWPWLLLMHKLENLLWKPMPQSTLHLPASSLQLHFSSMKTIAHLFSISKFNSKQHWCLSNCTKCFGLSSQTGSLVKFKCTLCLILQSNCKIKSSEQECLFSFVIAWTWLKHSTIIWWFT